MGTAVLRHGAVSDSFGSRTFPSGQYPKVSVGILVDRIPSLGSQSRKEDEVASPIGDVFRQSQGKMLECNQVLGKKAHNSEKQAVPEFINHTMEEGVHNQFNNNKENFADMDKEKHIENTENMSKINNGALRLKIWEILGTAPSQNKQFPNSPVLKEDAAITPVNKMCDNHKAKISSTKQNSDTIETDSESPKTTMKRPVTRSCTKKQDIKRTVTNLKLKSNSNRKELSSTLPGPTKNNAEKNVFSFDEKAGNVGGSLSHTNNTSSKVVRKRSNKNSCKVERRISFLGRSSKRKTESSEKEQPQPDSLTRTGHILSSPSKVKKLNLHQSNEDPENLSQNLETGHKQNPNGSFMDHMDTHESDSTSKAYNDSPKFMSKKLSPGKSMHENVDSPPPSSRNTQGINFKSPTFDVNVISASQKGTPSQEHDCSNIANKKPSDSVSLLSSKLQFSNSDAYIANSNNTRYCTASESMTEEMHHFKKTKSSEIHLSETQRRTSGSDSSEADDVSHKGESAEKWSPDTCSRMASPTFNHCKRLHSLGTEERNLFVEMPEQPLEDGIPRAIYQLAEVLGRFKAKIKSHTSKKSSQILSTVGDQIRLQFQDVESQIQADMGKFTSLSKLKRKRLESTLQEQQEKLKIIHEKFKQEISQHLLDCRSTLDELESFQMEMKANAELRKASHRKLLIQVEEAMQVQLSDAQSSITTIHKVARKKMDGLKYALREWLSEDNLEKLSC